MEARAKKAYSSKLSVLRQEKRIDSPLVRYNELDQPVCKVCNVPVKSESAWPAHQISRKHQEAVNSLKARATRAPSSASASVPGSTAASKLKIDAPVDEHVSKARPSSSLPADFFDKEEAKRPNTGSKGGTVTSQSSVKPVDVQLLEGDGERPSLLSNKSTQASLSKDDAGDKATLGRLDTNEGKVSVPDQQLGMLPKTARSSEAKQAKGALPEGFFDNKDADLRARGIEPVKVDIKEEYKEFQKVIQEDLQEFDDRLEEEEFDAAEWREATDYLEQKTYMERVEMLKKNLEERRAAKFNSQRKRPAFMAGESSEESSSEGEDEEETVDWRAKHL
ncbi:protein ABA AND ROS SENSITIVE 1 [Nymphaea colorata]|nr:protein ABA AND ROS SENSITIVE 1 [Nymphaea colorata]